MFRRKRLPPGLEDAHAAFLATVEPLERGKAALTESVPGTRLPGRPLAETLLTFEEGLHEADAGMAAWRVPELEREWLAADEAIRTCLAIAERVRLEAEMPAGFEALIGTIGDLMAPLGAFEQAERRFRSLRA
ncbi:MAG: hypothetical protein ACXWX0_11725 [Actinomycetota bacterium]